MSKIVRSIPKDGVAVDSSSFAEALSPSPNNTADQTSNNTQAVSATPYQLVADSFFIDSIIDQKVKSLTASISQASTDFLLSIEDVFVESIDKVIDMISSFNIGVQNQMQGMSADLQKRTRSVQPQPTGKLRNAQSKSRGMSDRTELKSLRDAIAVGESGGNYNTAFRRKGLTTPEQFSGKPLTEMTIGEVQQFQRQREGTLRGSGAVGKYQFIPSTLAALVAAEGISKEEKFTPEVQDRLFNNLTSQNEDYLRSKGYEPTPERLYMAHRIGPAGTVAVLKAVKEGKGNKTVEEIYRDAGFGEVNPDRSRPVNPELSRIPASKFEENLKSLLEKAGYDPTLDSNPSQAKSVDSNASQAVSVPTTQEQTLSSPSTTTPAETDSASKSKGTQLLTASEQSPSVINTRQPEIYIIKGPAAVSSSKNLPSGRPASYADISRVTEDYLKRLAS